jgi:hypothetical protein
MNLSTDVAKIVDRERFEAAHTRRLARMAEVYRTGPQSALVSSDDGVTPGWGARSIRTAQAYWWVPAGFAVLVLLRAIAGA